MAGLATVALAAAACGSTSNKSTSATTASSSTSSSSTTSSAVTKVKGGTVTFAEAPAAPPDYIFPMEGSTTFSTNNAQQLSYLLYRPLYWYGNNMSPTVDYNYSLADKPVFSKNNTVVTIHLKGWKWSNGETVTSKDVQFWMNMLNAVKTKGDWGAYVAGHFPDNVIKQSYPNSSTVVFTLNKSYNPTWFLYNELSQITPLPMAWDLTGPGKPGTCASATAATLASACVPVYNYLNAQSKAITSWGTSKIWGVVDGPFKVTSATSTGQVTFVPNTSYSGSPKPTISKFVEVPFTTATAEFNQLKSGAKALTFGQIPFQDIPQTSSVASSGGYRALTTKLYGYSYFPLNFHNPKFGPVFSQLYFRQAFQHLVDQKGWIHAFLHGAGVPTYGPVPSNIPSPWLSRYEKSNPYPFSISAAKKLLSSNGWSVKPNGTTTCVKPGSAKGDCGAGVKAGTALSFNLDYASGNTYATQEMVNLKSDAAKVGIKLSLTQHPFNSVVSAAAPCTAGQASCNWTMENWLGGWVYSPDFLPTGGELFATGASSNQSNYSSKTADKLIAATTTGPNSGLVKSIHTYENYIAKDLPVIFQPETTGNPDGGGPVMVSKKLAGVTFNAYSQITPETWYFTK